MLGFKFHISPTRRRLLSVSRENVLQNVVALLGLGGKVGYIESNVQHRRKCWYLIFRREQCPAIIGNKLQCPCNYWLLEQALDFIADAYWTLIGINKSTEWSTMPACPSLMYLFNRGNTEGTNSSKCLCLIFVYVLFYVNLCRDWFCGFWRICGLMTCVQSK